MTKDKFAELKKIWNEYAQSFNHLTKFVSQCELEVALQGNTTHRISQLEDNIIHTDFFPNSLKTKKAVSDESDTQNQYIFKISLSELQNALNSGSDENESARILKVPVAILRDAIKYYQSKGLL